MRICWKCSERCVSQYLSRFRSHHVLKCRLVDMSYAVDVKLTFDITCIKDKVENECLPANIGCLWETTCSKCPDQSA
ncbi:hypothetical protein H5410_016542 [Solanum commersonii]|uniref:Uncharacterized protein n=1 Tax=Solanum commersonii TaxID=4109 RepID=A0A9J5ZWN6_SOLCO|nr:hypothetical protein H5410_016542 [Solanum commersonii]